MSDEPMLPMIPDIGEIMGRKDRVYEKKSTVIKCKNCNAKNTRTFKVGDYTFKKVTDEQCAKCNNENTLTIVEIYSEWIDPKKPTLKENEE